MTDQSYFPEGTQLFWFWKGRAALNAILRAMEVGSGDDVVVPGFTCFVVPSAVVYTGANPVYADIDPDTYNVTASTVARVLTAKTKAILVQNTFGLSPDLEPILELAERRRVPVIEDCAHGLGSSYRGRNCGTLTHAAFFSSQWSKPISTGLGGLATTSDPLLAARIKAVLASFASPTFAREALLLLQVLLRPLADKPELHYPLIRCYRFLTQEWGLSVGSSTNRELTTTDMPPLYELTMGSRQKRLFMSRLAAIDQALKHRRRVAAYYDDILSKIKGIERPRQPEYALHGMLRYPVAVPNKKKVLDKAMHLKVPLGDWFISPLHPLTRGLEKWGYIAGSCPCSENACRHTVNLFTDHAVPAKKLESLFSGIG